MSSGSQLASQRTIHVVTQMEAGGSQGAALRMAEQFRARGIAAETVFLYVKRPVFETNNHVHAIATERPKSVRDHLRVFVGLIRFLRTKHPTAVFTYGRFANPFGQFAALLAGVRTRVASQRSLASSYPRSLRMADLLAGSVGLYTTNIAVSETARASFSKHTSSYSSRMIVVHNGIAPKLSVQSREATRAKLGVPIDAPLVVTVGRLAPVKNQSILLKAVSALCGVHLALAGGGEDRENLEQQARDLGIDDRVHFVGEIPSTDVSDFLGAGDVFAFPSIHESFGFALVEAMCAGLPIVCSEIDAFQEVLTLGGKLPPAGRMVGPSDLDSWIEALRRVIEDRELRSELVRAAKERGNSFSLGSMVDGYVRCLR